MNGVDGLSLHDSPFSLTPSFTLSLVPADETLFTRAFLNRATAMIQAGMMHQDFTPAWDENRKYDNYRRTVFGPTFGPYDHDMPGPGHLEARSAVSRMIALRNPSVPGFSKRLTRNQIRTFTGPLLRNVHHRFFTQLHSNINFGTYEEKYPEWLFQPHAKRQLRIQVHNESVIMGSNTHDEGTPVGFKLKPNELLAPGKQRGVGDLGVMRTDATAYVWSDIKDAWSVPFIHNNWEFEYCKSPDKELLSSVFEKLIDVPYGKAYFCYFSDDSCCAAHCRDGIVRFNADIKACDGSHFDPVFTWLERNLTKSAPYGTPNVFKDAIHRSFKYLGNKLRMRDPNSKKKIDYEFSSKRLYSGSTSTVVVNNGACVNIAFCAQIRVPDPSTVTKAEFIEAFRLGAEDAGYWVKFDLCDCIEKLQFLKHSPSEVEGRYVPWVNIGTYFKNFGHCVHDVPGRGLLAKRASIYVSEIVRSRLNWGDHAINDAFRHLIIDVRGDTKGLAYREVMVEKSIGGNLGRVSLESISSRYDCNVYELEELIHFIERSGLNTHLCLPIIEKILKQDYG